MKLRIFNLEWKYNINTPTNYAQNKRHESTIKVLTVGNTVAEPEKLRNMPTKSVPT